ncbi:hypothetical protein TL16_g07395 [Triparma laevis f. inornata]|uniref:FAD/NAD(P)-binding domain-containing protein n=1 Tax=Triparma laevis f. inornata TaxID=1714386 RepID=A0A9W7EDM1_9STRA|nr:hypothetical protein TL16_g07395 [Triparma laevis f. inornata]
MISPSQTLKLASESEANSSANTNAASLLKEITIYDLTPDEFRSRFPKVELVRGSVTETDPSSHTVQVTLNDSLTDSSASRTIAYKQICFAVGAVPSPGPLPNPSWLSTSNSNSFVHTIRDAESVQNLKSLTEDTHIKKIVVVGNGAIAMEIVHALTTARASRDSEQRTNHVQNVDWVVRDRFLGHTLLDATAAAFILPSLTDRMRKLEDEFERNDNNSDSISNSNSNSNSNDDIEEEEVPRKKQRTGDNGNGNDNPPSRLKPVGAALGPYWFDKFRNATASPSSASPSSALENPFTNARCACHSCKPGFFCFPSAGFDPEMFSQEEKKGGGNLRVVYEAKIVAFREKGVAKFSLAAGLTETERGDAEKRMEGLRGAVNRSQILLSDDEVVDCDALIVACGVDSGYVIDSVLGEEGGRFFRRGRHGTLKVDKQMRCVGAGGDCFAAGDCCDLSDFEKENELFHQMQLWSQAKIEGSYTAHCMLGMDEELQSDFCFETTFLDKKVVLLGLFNGQKMGGKMNEFVMTEEGLAKEVSEGGGKVGGLVEPSCEVDMARNPPISSDKPAKSIVSTKKIGDGDVKILTRVKQEKEYVKCIVSGGRVVGAMLVGGAVDLADTMEQIMMSRINVDALDFDLLDDNIEIDEYFD